ncbi:MAG: hypothetical protein IPM92_02620 [Saprospiraceae bacterium]|nr:hypothetical protein [Saprospiraceae bacterium]
MEIIFFRSSRPFQHPDQEVCLMWMTKGFKRVHINGIRVKPSGRQVFPYNPAGLYTLIATNTNDSRSQSIKLASRKFAFPEKMNWAENILIRIPVKVKTLTSFLHLYTLFTKRKFSLPEFQALEMNRSNHFKLK